MVRRPRRWAAPPAAALVAAAAAAAVVALALAVAQAPPAAPPPVEVAPPAWRLLVYEVQDPYRGRLARPAEPAPGMRYVAVDLALANGSDVALEAAEANVRLRDAEGREYAGGRVVGAEARLPARLLGRGEQARGWVWFEVPADARLAQLAYLASAPEFRLPWAEAPVATPAPATPPLATPAPATPAAATPAAAGAPPATPAPEGRAAGSPVATAGDGTGGPAAATAVATAAGTGGSGGRRG